MVRRTTIEIDEQLLARAKRALGRSTIRATIEEALRRAVEHAEEEHVERATRQRRFLASLDAWLDLDVPASEPMGR